MTFAELKIAAENAKTAAELYRVADAANKKLLLNVGRAKLMSYTHGRAAEADHFFQNVIPEWNRITNEIFAMLRSAMADKSADEIVAIITSSEIEAAA